MLSLPPPGSSQLLLVWATWASAPLVSLLILLPKTCITNMRSRFLSHYSLLWQNELCYIIIIIIITITYIDSSSFWKVPKLFLQTPNQRATSCCMWKNNCEKLISAYPLWASSIFFSTCFLLFFFSFFLLTEIFGIEALESRDSWLGALDKLSLKKKKQKKKRRRRRRRNSSFFFASSI